MTVAPVFRAPSGAASNALSMSSCDACASAIAEKLKIAKKTDIVRFMRPSRQRSIKESDQFAIRQFSILIRANGLIQGSPLPPGEGAQSGVRAGFELMSN